MAELIEPLVPFASPPRPTPPKAPRPVAWIGVTAFIVLGVVLLFCGAMTRGVTYDEDQHIAAGVMARFVLPYRDFTYLQPPLYPLLLGTAFEFAGGWYLLMARLITFGLALLSGGLLWHLVRRLGAGLPLAGALLLACLASPFLLAPLANARNDALPLALMLAGLAAHLWAGDARGPGVAFAGRVAAALLFGLAVEAKLTYLFGPAAIGLHALADPRRRLAPVLAGLLLAASPALFFAIEAPEAFRFGLLDYHLAAPAAWYDAVGQAALLGPLARLDPLLDYGAVGGNLALVFLAVAYSLLATIGGARWQPPGRLLLGLTLGALGVAMIPAPSWPMYYAPVPPLLACCVAHLARTVGPIATQARHRTLAGLAGLLVLPFLGLQAAELPRLFDPARWVGVQVHREAQAIRDLVPQGAGGGEVATLFPMLVIEASPVRREFASGPFVFRSAQAFDPALLDRIGALAPDRIEAAFRDLPPDAIYEGRYADAWPIAMDAALAAYAARHHWTLIRTDPLGGRLWLRP